MSSITSLTITMKSFLQSNLNIKTNKAQLATVLCSASIASTVGYQLYRKWIESTQYKCRSTPFNYNNYKRILTASAPGNIILCGELAVVYGVAAISTAIDKRINVTILEPLDNDESPINSRLGLKLECVYLEWKMSDLIALHNLNTNKWNYKLIQNKYHLFKPKISFTQNIEIEYIKNHPLYSQKDWDQQITSVLVLLLFQCFSKLFSDQIFISYGIVIDVQSDIPIGAGLGSSSAWSTALSAVLYYYWVYATAGQRKTKIASIDVETTSRIWKLAYETEKINHGTPSGIDNATSVYGGYIKFKNRENLHVIDADKHFVHCVPLLVINTGIIGNTKKILYKKHKTIINSIFESIEQISDKMIHLLMDENVSPQSLYRNINELFLMNHGLLISIGVGHSVINNIQNICTEYGFGKGFKITNKSIIVSLLNKHNKQIDNELINRFRKKLFNKGYESHFIQTAQTGLLCKFY